MKLVEEKNTEENPEMQIIEKIVLKFVFIVNFITASIHYNYIIVIAITIWFIYSNVLF